MSEVTPIKEKNNSLRCIGVPKKTCIHYPFQIKVIIITINIFTVNTNIINEYFSRLTSLVTKYFVLSLECIY